MRFFKLTPGARSPLLFLFLLSFLPPSILSARGGTELPEETLTIGAVQFAVSEEIYNSMESFRLAAEEALIRLEEKAAAANNGKKLDLAVFPEYTSAFPGLSFLNHEEITALSAAPQDSLPLIKQALRMAEPEIMSMWCNLARAHGYAILAGTALLLDEEGNIRNRALLFSPEGELIWSQDKVFPGAPEVSLLKLKTGKIADARPFEIKGFRIVTTICRDTYHKEWEKALGEADLWIDIKANELPYTPAYYDEALPSRLPGSLIDSGLTVSLSGAILGFSFTGPTFYMNDYDTISSTDPYAKDSLLIIALEHQ